MSDKRKSEQPVYTPPEMDVMKAVQEVSAQSFREPDWKGGDLGLAIELWMLHRFYDGTIDSSEGPGHPIHPIAAIICSADADVAPPQWAMGWLSNAFRRFVGSRGDADLNELLGIAAVGGGSNREGSRFPVKEYFQEKRRYLRAALMHPMVKVRGFKRRTAAQIIVEKCPGVTADALEKDYRKNWESKFDCAPELLDDWTPWRASLPDRLMKLGNK